MKIEKNISEKKHHIEPILISTHWAPKSIFTSSNCINEKSMCV